MRPRAILVCCLLGAGSAGFGGERRPDLVARLEIAKQTTPVFAQQVAYYEAGQGRTIVPRPNLTRDSYAWLVGQPPSAQDEAIWQQFEAWVAALPALAPGDSVPLRDRYVASLVQQGMARKEAERRYERILVIRHESVDRERVYWDGAFKSGAGPDSPLRLLQETIRKLKPGRALDAGMGRGRNSIFLASVGWDTTGYDISAEALKAARAYAEKAGVKVRTVQARHDTFPFGDAQWDLILCAYCYIRPEEAQWPEVFWKALRPGGLVVYQTFVDTQKPVSDLIDRWRRFRVLRVEDWDAGVVDDDWMPSRPTIKLVVRKE